MRRLILFLTRFGTVPFVLLALATIVDPAPFTSRWHIIFLAYSGLIISFIGGINWGIFVTHREAEVVLGVRDSKILILWSTGLMLLAWVFLFMHMTPIAFYLMAVLYAVEIFVELKIVKKVYPGWLLTGRIPMMVVSIVSLCLAGLL